MEDEKIKKRKPKEDKPEEEIFPKPFQKIEKRSYLVILVTPSKVIYEVSKDNLSHTPNIWGANLKPGDKITL